MAPLPALKNILRVTFMCGPPGVDVQLDKDNLNPRREQLQKNGGWVVTILQPAPFLWSQHLSASQLSASQLARSTLMVLDFRKARMNPSKFRSREKEQLELKKLLLEIERLTAEIQGRDSTEKDQLELKKLRSETRPLGTFGRTGWPILYAFLTVTFTGAIGLTTYRIQQHQTDLQDRSSLLAALTSATSTSSSHEARLGGVWSLSRFWDESPQVVGNTLTAILVTGNDHPNDEERWTNDLIRTAAAEALGQGLSGRPSDLNPNEEQIKHRALILFGDGRSGRPGAITLVHWSLMKERKAGGKNVGPDLWLRIEATKEVVRKWSRYLDQAHLRDFDLSCVTFDSARLARAVLIGVNFYRANLQGAHLESADVNGADLRCADLQGANLNHLQGIEHARWTNANVYQLTPENLRDQLKNQYHAVDLAPEAWSAYRATNCPGAR